MSKRNNQNYDYESEEGYRQNAYGGVTRATPTTLGVGRFNENRGRRGDEDPRGDNPFENGKLHNWNRRQGWDEYYDQSYDRGNRNHGGALMHHDLGRNYRGLGPKGYKRPDQRIYEDVCEMLSLSPDVDASDIDVSVKEGCVFLNGTVDGRETKRTAELVIENVSGVMDVQNLLTVRREQGEGRRTDNNDGDRARALS